MIKKFNRKKRKFATSYNLREEQVDELLGHLDSRSKTPSIHNVGNKMFGLENDLEEEEYVKNSQLDSLDGIKRSHPVLPIQNYSKSNQNQPQISKLGVSQNHKNQLKNSEFNIFRKKSTGSYSNCPSFNSRGVEKRLNRCQKSHFKKFKTFKSDSKKSQNRPSSVIPARATKVSIISNSFKGYPGMRGSVDSSEIARTMGNQRINSGANSMVMRHQLTEFSSKRGSSCDPRAGNGYGGRLSIFGRLKAEHQLDRIRSIDHHPSQGNLVNKPNPCPKSLVLLESAKNQSFAFRSKSSTKASKSSNQQVFRVRRVQRSQLRCRSQKIRRKRKMVKLPVCDESEVDELLNQILYSSTAAGGVIFNVDKQPGKRKVFKGSGRTSEGFRGN